MAVLFLLLAEPSFIRHLTEVSQVTYTVIKINTRTTVCFVALKELPPSL